MASWNAALGVLRKITWMENRVLTGGAGVTAVGDELEQAARTPTIEQSTSERDRRMQGT
jgi:hypothetical protein